MKAVIFDFDGVIHDTFELGHGLNKKIYGDFSEEDFKNLFDGNLYAHKIVSPDKIEMFFRMAESEYAKLRITDDVKDELLRLKKKYDIFIITSVSEKILHRYFADSGCPDLFTEILGVETHKSKVEKFKILFKKYGLAKDDCVFVTDTLGDILEANHVGVITIAVDYGFHERERLEKGNPKRIVSHFKEIMPAVEEISKSGTVSHHA